VIGLPLCYFLEGIDLGRFTGNIWLINTF
jgi:hypothetical protein